MPNPIEFTEAERLAFPHKPFAIRHTLADHPLLQLESLVRLAGEMPREDIEYNSGSVGVNQDAKAVPTVDLEPIEVVRRIREANAWMVLKRVEQMPAYKQLLKDVLDGVARDLGHKDADDAAFSNIEGFIFVSSANATTPFHCDPEDNFFVQIHGDKFFHIFDNSDGSLVPDADLEFDPGSHRNLAYKPEFEQRASVFSMKGGDGCFVPYQWPHWVRTGNSYSISMAITWKSREVKRANRVLFVNALLRRMGLPQPRPGRRPMVDAIKVAAYSVARGTMSQFRNIKGHTALRRWQA